MLQWEVLDKQPLPDEPEPRRRTRRGVVGWLVVAGLLLLLAWVAGRERIRDNEARLRQDIVQMVEWEEEARRVGATAQASLLMDPEAPQSWRLWYESFFKQPAASPPQVVAVEVAAGVAVATLNHQAGAQAWQSERAYRLVQGEWRRTPMPAARWGTPQPYHSAHFTLWMSERDAATLPPDKFLPFLESFRAGFLSRWPAASDAPLTLHIEPHDLEPLRIGPPAPLAPLHLNSPLLISHLDMGTLPPPDAYRLAVADAIATALDVTAADALSSSMLRGEYAEASLYSALRYATVRALVLTEAEQQSYRRTIRAQATAQQGLDQATVTFLADYLTVIKGEDAPGRLAVAYRQSTTLEAATVQAFGLPLSDLVDETRLWLEASGPPADARTRQHATVLRVLEAEPLRVAGVVGQELLDLQADAPQALPVAAPCLGSGSTISFRRPPTDTTMSELRLERLHLPTWNPRPLPLATVALVSQEAGTTTRIVAVEAGSDTLTEFMRLPGTAPLAVHPGGEGFAFLFSDRCGPSVNRYDAATNRFTRVAVPTIGTGHLFWSGDTLLLLDDASDATRAPHWSLMTLETWNFRERLTIPVAQGQAWGRYLGYQGGAAPQHLMEGADGQRFRLSATDGSVAPLLPTEMPLPDTLGLVAQRPGWLAYSVPDAPDGPELYLVDVARARRYLLHQAAPGSRFTSLVLGRGAPPAVTSAVQTPGSDAYLKRFTFPPPPDALPLGDTLTLPDTVQDLRGCTDGRLFYRLTHEGSPRLAEGFRYLPTFFPTDGQVVACIRPAGSVLP